MRPKNPKVFRGFAVNNLPARPVKAPALSNRQCGGYSFFYLQPPNQFNQIPVKRLRIIGESIGLRIFYHRHRVRSRGPATVATARDSRRRIHSCQETINRNPAIHLRARAI
ncbi:hypothetical protein [Burkholderia stabilis]|uniref:hypothetical protein n=1 Tax=Burkholderia stabilis TaxID=95485 RepID=UPI00159261D1|nr:hypothetical protein [Burkholderia stabilis]